MSNYNKIRSEDISNGPGIRVSIFFQGCHFHCKECFNEITWDFAGGKPFTEDTITEILSLSSDFYISGLSILGGEPLCDENIESVNLLINKFKQCYPNKSIWVWTGYTFEQIRDKIKNFNIDVLVDGKFDITKKDFHLKYCGSTNQRFINFKKSIKENKIILYE